MKLSSKSSSQGFLLAPLLCNTVQKEGKDRESETWKGEGKTWHRLPFYFA